MALLAVPGDTDFLCFSSFASSSMAFSPKGVAAQPSPRKLAIIFAEINSMARCSPGTSGNKNPRRGLIFLVRRSTSPELFCDFHNPHPHSHDSSHGNTKRYCLFRRRKGSICHFIHAACGRAIYNSNQKHSSPEKIQHIFTHIYYFALIYAGYLLFMLFRLKILNPE